MSLVKLVCVNNSGTALLADDSETACSNVLTVGEVYTGKVENGEFTTVDDMGETAVFDVERFQQILQVGER